MIELCVSFFDKIAFISRQNCVFTYMIELFQIKSLHFLLNRIDLDFAFFF